MFLSPRKRENTSHTKTIGLSKEMDRVEVGEGEGEGEVRSGLPASAVFSNSFSSKYSMCQGAIFGGSMS